MAEVINTPAHEHVVHEDSGSNSMMNLLMGILVIGALLFMIFYFGGPLLRGAGGGGSQQINNNAPPQGQSGAAPQINVPDKVNVDVKTPQGQ